MILYIFFLIILIIFSEFFFQFWVNSIRKIFDRSFAWKKPIITNIITNHLDNIPIYKNEELLRHKLYFYDRDLGTSNRPNITNTETHFEENRKIVTKYSIGNLGERVNYSYRFKNNYSSYGDSLCFGRFVNDNQTWQYLLTKKIKKNIKNFGVGNYGLDQAFLKLKKNFNSKKDKSKNVIFLFGPEVIRRNLSLWKHYYEFGNYFNVKPAFIYDNKFKKFKYIAVQNYFSNKEFNFEKLKKKTYKIDFFYKNKFLKYLWKFPYLLCLFYNPKRKLYLLIYFTYFHFKKKFEFNIKLIEKNKHYKKFLLLGGLYFDFEDKIQMYKNSKSIKATTNIIKEISKYCKKNKIKSYFVLVPSYYDLKYYNEEKKHYYKSLEYAINKELKNISYFDLTKKLSEYNHNKIYADKTFGGHLNSYGHRILSKLIFNLVSNENNKNKKNS